MIYVYTSIVDGFDNLRSPAAPANDCVRYICFTNVPNLPRVYPWEYRPIYDVGKPCRTARVAKILPHLMLPPDAEYSIYHDGNFQLRQDPDTMIQAMLYREQWAAHRHPCRNCIYEEANILLNDPGMDGWRKQNPERVTSVEQEIARYRSEGFPEKAGLWANGLLIRKHTPEVAKLNERWWSLYMQGCERDQISFPVARQQMGMDVHTINDNVFSSPWMKFNWHAAWRVREDNSDFWSERERTRERLTRLKEVTGSTNGIHYADY